jgi:hypothetical protein
MLNHGLQRRLPYPGPPLQWQGSRGKDNRNHQSVPLAARCRSGYGSVTASINPAQITEVLPTAWRQSFEYVTDGDIHQHARIFAFDVASQITQ